MGNQGKTLVMMGLGAVAMVVLSIIILNRRVDAGFMRRPVSTSVPGGRSCATRWSPSSFPAPVALEQASSELEPDLKAAIGFWNNSGAGPLFNYVGLRIDPSMERDPIVTIASGTPHEGDDPGMEAIGDAFVQWGAPVGDVCPIRRVQIGFAPVRSEADRRRGLAHELGHALGLDHDTFEDSVMYSKTLPTDYIVRPNDLRLLLSPL